jgi:hypothetical protein
MSDKFENPILELKLADLPLSANPPQDSLMELEKSEEGTEDDAA